MAVLFHPKVRGGGGELAGKVRGSLFWPCSYCVPFMTLIANIGDWGSLKVGDYPPEHTLISERSCLILDGDTEMCLGWRITP